MGFRGEIPLPPSASPVGDFVLALERLGLERFSPFPLGGVGERGRASETETRSVRV